MTMCSTDAAFAPIWPTHRTRPSRLFAPKSLRTCSVPAIMEGGTRTHEVSRNVGICRTRVPRMSCMRLSEVCRAWVRTRRTHYVVKPLRRPLAYVRSLAPWRQTRSRRSRAEAGECHGAVPARRERRGAGCRNMFYQNASTPAEGPLVCAPHENLHARCAAALRARCPRGGHLPGAPLALRRPVPRRAHQGRRGRPGEAGPLLCRGRQRRRVEDRRLRPHLDDHLRRPP